MDPVNYGDEKVFFPSSEMLKESQIPSFSFDQNHPLHIVLIVAGFFLEKEIDDLVGLIDCPEASSYLFKIDTSTKLFALFSLKKNIVLSAKSRWFTRGLPRATRMPSICPSSCARRQSPERNSLHRMDMYGERGSP